MKYVLWAIVGIIMFAWLFSLCSPAGGLKTGHEYMPDMVHPVSYEANLYSAYEWNHWDKESVKSKAELSRPRSGVEGTVPRGMTAVYYTGSEAISNIRGGNAVNAIAAPVNGHAPFYYQNTEADRYAAERDMVNNPFPITKEGLDRAKPLYDIYCGICHGKDGKGEGDLIKTEKYPAAPKNLIADDMIAAGNGRYYFAMMYGKNVMGGYSDKLSYEERWQVIHYIRSMQAAEKQLEYSEKANTLSNVEKPANGTASGPARAGNTVQPPAPPVN